MYSHVQQIECLRFILKANVYSQLLHKYRLKEVRNLVWEIRSKWEDLGIELDLSPDSRETIKMTHPQDVSSCFRGMLSLWLKRATPPPSWQEMADALRSKAIGRDDIACEVEAKAQEKKE